MAAIVAHPGDRIVITEPSFKSNYNMEFIVVESEYSEPTPDRIWVKSKIVNRLIWLYHGEYRIVLRKSVLDMSKEKTGSNSESCPDCHDTGEIKLLVSIVPCKCRKGGVK